MKLAPRIIEKPWGRVDIPAELGGLGSKDGQRIGEIWYEKPDQATSALMVKYLFTSERLSVQVHPDNDAAAALGHRSGKDECWLVIEATDDAEIGIGLVRNVSPAELRQATEAGTVERLINWRPVKAGDFLYNPAGTIHAIGPGLSLIEIQQNSDCTYRLYDYGRPRDLHVEAALAIAHTGPHDRGRDCHVPTTGTVTLATGPHFHVVRAHAPVPDGILPANQPLTIVPLNGKCHADGEPVAPGECAEVTDASAIALAHGAQALICWVEPS